jgi:hypothetical protein
MAKVYEVSIPDWSGAVEFGCTAESEESAAACVVESRCLDNPHRNLPVVAVVRERGSTETHRYTVTGVPVIYYEAEREDS